jgi:hypothetical protein
MMPPWARGGTRAIELGNDGFAEGTLSAGHWQKAGSSFQFLERHKTGADELSVRTIPHAARDARHRALSEDL